MARNRDPFTLALSSLRERLQSGNLVGGAPIIVQDEAKALHLSTTPVREALARLSGEGLVERGASGGYLAVRLDAAAARDRYAMQAHYIRISTDLNHRALGGLRPPAPLADARLASVRVSLLFATVVRSAANQVLWDAFQKVRGQLDLIARFEPRLFDNLEEEATFLLAAYDHQDAARFDEAVAAYHQPRIGASGALAALVARG